jgi:hypothetical protein
MPDVIMPKLVLSVWITILYAEHFILLIRQTWAHYTSGFSRIWKECSNGGHSTNLMNSCPLSRKFWEESIWRLWMRDFKNGSSNCKMNLWKSWIC